MEGCLTRILLFNGIRQALWLSRLVCLHQCWQVVAKDEAAMLTFLSGTCWAFVVLGCQASQEGQAGQQNICLILVGQLCSFHFLPGSL